MPKFPEFAERTKNVGGSVFEKFRPKMQQRGSNLVKLHIGDTYLTPPYSIPIDKNFLNNNEGFNRYCDTFGIYSLREALSVKVNTDNQLLADPDQILMTCGATNALNTAVQTLVNPGEDVIVLTPTWPFFKGMVTIAGGNVIEVPLYVRLYREPELDISGYIESLSTTKTVAIYLNTPNNPSGKVLNRNQLRQVADFAQKNRLWIISDEAYDGMTYDNHDHVSIGSLSGMYNRTISIFTFSKVFMFSGLRLGYIVTDATTIKNLNKMMVHQLYSPATISQQMMVEPVKNRAEWRDQFVRHCRELRDLFTANLKISPQVPEGSYYLFFSTTEHLNGREYWEVIDECLGKGVSIAPGDDFGEDFHDYVRICFTGEKPERLEIAIDRLNEIFPA
jgi:aspartate/methionine/tyrosine aminotransferase